MLVKSDASKVKGGNGYRRFLILLHFLLWLAATAVGLVYLLNKLVALELPVITDVLKKATDLCEPFSKPVFDAAAKLLPFDASLEVLAMALALVWLLLLWSWSRLLRRSYIFAETNVGSLVFMGKVFQVVRTPSDEDLAWFDDRKMDHPLPEKLRMKRRPMIIFGKVDLTEDEAEPAVEAETIAEPETMTEDPATEIAEEITEPEVAEEIAEELPVAEEPEIIRIIREAEEREATAVAAPAPAAEPAPATEPAPVAEPAPAAAVESAPAADEADEEEQDQEIREMTVNGRTFRVVIRYSRSFEARMAQSDDMLKRHYAEIKRELCSFARVNSRKSWKHDAFNCGRIQLAKIVVRGKNLCLYLALDPAAYPTEKYHHTDCSAKSAYAKVPMLLRVRSELGLRKAKQLIAEMMENFDIARAASDETDYVAEFPYRDTKTLIAEGLVKELEGQEIG